MRRLSGWRGDDLHGWWLGGGRRRKSSEAFIRGRNSLACFVFAGGSKVCALSRTERRRKREEAFSSVRPPNSLLSLSLRAPTVPPTRMQFVLLRLPRGILSLLLLLLLSHPGPFLCFADAQRFRASSSPFSFPPKRGGLKYLAREGTLSSGSSLKIFGLLFRNL